ncbi:hypothetical protein C8F04DRAFT_148716 [Mycena alexandri]|uniref:Uncharacterized protein n=1 Tax=Mycena alexandri TaxID=1745969 RepID=A0AAD6WS20_9AGAR|nr:hypothetical protein C8F04DRAFT_148716 [Mycena alexandri]
MAPVLDPETNNFFGPFSAARRAHWDPVASLPDPFPEGSPSVQLRSLAHYLARSALVPTRSRPFLARFASEYTLPKADMGVTTGRRKSKRVSTARSKLHIASLVAMDDRDSDDDSEIPAAIPIPDEDDKVSESGDDDKAECEEDDDNQDDDDEEGAGSQESQGDDSSVGEKRKRAL